MKAIGPNGTARIDEILEKAGWSEGPTFADQGGLHLVDRESIVRSQKGTRAFGEQSEDSFVAALDAHG
jgi:hypothetical protein